MIELPGIVSRRWHPNRIANLLGAWEADDPAILVTSGRASSVPGRYGTAATLAEVGSSGPTLSATGWNASRPCFVFVGAQYLTTSSVIPAALSGTDTPYTAIWAGEISTTPGNYNPWSVYDHLSDRTSGVVSVSNTTLYYNARVSSSVVDQKSYSSVAPTGRVIRAARYRGQNDFDMFAAGSLVTANTTTTTLAATVMTFTRFVLGVGWAGSLISYFAGNIGALWLYSRALPDAEIALASTQMAVRWP